jgi:signal transduction histidine kinase
MPEGTIIDRLVTESTGVGTDLLDLAPLNLPNLRPERYKTENFGVPLGTFALVDQEIVLRIYRQIIELLAVLSVEASVEAVSQALHDFVGRPEFDDLRYSLRALGLATFAGAPPDPLTAKAIHDMRGGALAVLLVRLEMAGERPFTKSELRTLFLLARDHSKIMRNAVLDIDPARRQKDLSPQSHHVRLLVEKWHHATIGLAADGRRVELFVDSRFDGAVTECCLESAAIDRVFYNLMANAQRHNASNRLDLTIFEIPATPGENLRFVLRNAVSEADEARLGALPSGDAQAPHLDALFTAGVSTTGSGLGLAIVADLVTQAFGIYSEMEALRLGYFGARLIDGKFTIWFHWPVARDGLGVSAVSDAAEEVPQDLQNAGNPPSAATGVNRLAQGILATGTPV